MRSGVCRSFHGIVARDRGLLVRSVGDSYNQAYVFVVEFGGYLDIVRAIDRIQRVTGTCQFPSLNAEVLMDWYLEALRNYAVFEGRARRREYWFFVLFNSIIFIVLAIVDSVMSSSEFGPGILSGIYSLAVFIPGLAVTVRRLHDTGRSGWWILIELVPIIGAIVLLVFLFTDSEPGTNEYGPNPKESFFSTV